MPRIALCGGFKIGVESSEPNVPPLVIVNVPPCRSSTAIVPSRALVAYCGDGLLDRGERALFGIADDRHHEPAIGADGHADVVEVLVNDFVAFDAGVDGRETP